MDESLKEPVMVVGMILIILLSLLGLAVIITNDDVKIKIGKCYDNHYNEILNTKCKIKCNTKLTIFNNQQCFE